MSTHSILPPAWQIPTILRERLGDGPGRQRVMQADGHLLIITHAPPNVSQKTRNGRFFWRSPDGEWQSNELGSGKGALAKHLDQYAQAIESLEKAENDAQSSEDYFQVISQLAPLLRAARNLHATLQSAREKSGNDRTMINYRDRSYAIERSAELLYNEAKNELDFLIARRSEQQAVSSHRMATASHRLNILAAFFFPIVTLATIFRSEERRVWK